MVKQVEFMKQIRTVKYSFNTTGTANYRVQLAVPPSIKIIIVIIILFSKKVNKQVHFNLSIDYSRSKKVLKQAGVVHNTKSQ